MEKYIMLSSLEFFEYLVLNVWKDFFGKKWKIVVNKFFMCK